jgi:hypothetical protein
VLLLVIAPALLVGVTTWVLFPGPIHVSITVEPAALVSYDDHAGKQGLSAEVRVTNVSTMTIWFLGLPGTPAYADEQLVDGKWKMHTAAVTVKPTDFGLPEQWTPLHPMESITIAAGPISEGATELRVAVPFTSEWIAPTKAHWVFSPVVRIAKRGKSYFPETKPGAQQEEQIVRLPWVKSG